MPGHLLPRFLLRDYAAIDNDLTFLASPVTLLNLVANDRPMLMGRILHESPLLELATKL